ncbi:hypothetical protein L3X07_03870 [Levilactobacillus brevis]|nr:hypothetical protein [Levilactobacillus brevis]
MTEWEKCLAGLPYDCHATVFLDLKQHARQLLAEYAHLTYEQKSAKRALIQKLFGRIGTNVSVGQPFICDYGRNISLGNNVSINMNCTFVDCNRITIGNNVLIASNVQLYTALIRLNVMTDWYRTGHRNNLNISVTRMPYQLRLVTVAGSVAGSSFSLV